MQNEATHAILETVSGRQNGTSVFSILFCVGYYLLLMNISPDLLNRYSNICDIIIRFVTCLF